MHLSKQLTAVRILALLIITAPLLAACDNSKAIEAPAKLVDIKTTLKVRKLWSEGLGSGDGAKHLLLALQPTVLNGVVYAAGHTGKVEALSADKGKLLWHAKTKLSLSAGPAAADGLVVVGSSNGLLVVLDAKTGHEKWRHQVSGEILAKPLITNGLIIVRTVNGRVQAFDAIDAKSRWVIEESVPKLTLRGTAAPILAGSAVITGFDNGKLVAVDAATGDAMWNVTIDTPVGRTELDRLGDVDATAIASGRDVFVVGYQGRIAMVEQATGQIWWSQDASSYRGFGLDDDSLYLSAASGVVSSIRRATGAQQWEQTSLRHRGLTAPGVIGNTLVVGDFEGYLHWLDKSTGTITARVSTDGQRISNTPVVADDRVFVQTDGGKVIAFAIKPIG